MTRLFLFFLSISFSFCIAGSPEKELLVYKQKYPTEKAIYTKRQQSMLIDMRKDSVYIEYENFSEIFHLGEQTGSLTDQSVSFSGFSEITDLEAYTMVPAKKSYNKVKVDKFTTESVSESGIFYNDYKEMKFVFPTVQLGCKTVLHYKEIIKNPFLTNVFILSSFLISENTEFSIKVHSSIKISPRIFGSKQNFELTEKTEGDYKIYKWVLKNAPKYITDENGPNFRYHEPHLYVLVDEYTVNSKTTKVLGTTQDLYNWYYGLISNVNKENEVELKILADSIIKDCKSDLEKAKKIFDWVQDNIRYIAFEDGYAGFIPREAKLVCEKRYGDCKDMAGLVAKLLRMAKLDGHVAWIGTQDIPYHFDKLPSPSAANHMIAVLKLNNEYLFLDATGKFMNLGTPTAFIQGKYALIENGPTKFEIKTVPIVDAFTNQISDSSVIEINKNNVIGTSKSSFPNYTKSDILFAMYRKNDDKEIITKILEKGSNKFFIDNYTIQNAEKRELPLVIDYKFRIEGYVKNIKNEIYINLHLNKQLQSDIIDSVRVIPRVFEKQFQEKETIVLKIPEGYKLNYVPENTSFKTDTFGFDFKYEVRDSSLILHKIYYIKTLQLEKKSFKDWNKMVELMSESYSELVTMQLK